MDLLRGVDGIKSVEIGIPDEISSLDSDKFVAENAADEERIIKIDVKLVADILSYSPLQDNWTNSNGTNVRDDVGEELFLYAVRCWPNGPTLKKNSAVMSCPSCGIHVQSINRIGIALRRPIPVDALATDFDMNIRKHFPLRAKFQLLDKRVVTSQELIQMQRFHRSVMCWQPNPQDSPHDTPVSPDQWSESSNGAWYVIFPLQENYGRLDRDTLRPMDTTSLREDDSWYHFLQTAADEADELARMLVDHNSKQELPVMSIPKSSVSASDLEGYLFRRNDFFELFVGLHHHPPINLRDPLDATYRISFYEYYKKKNRFPLNELNEIYRTPGHRMVFALAISGRLSLIPLLSPISGEEKDLVINPQTKKKKQAPAVIEEDVVTNEHSHATTMTLIPEYCERLGRAVWFYIGQFAPSLVWQLQALVLAVDARELVSSKMRTLPVWSWDLSSESEGCLGGVEDSTSVHGDGDDVKQTQTQGRFPYSQVPSPALMLEAMTPRMAAEMFDSERLEMLGDSLLKFVTSVELYRLYPQEREGGLSSLRGAVISNDNLARVARRFGFIRYLRALRVAKGKQSLCFTPSGMLPDVPSSIWNTCIVKVKKAEEKDVVMEPDELGGELAEIWLDASTSSSSSSLECSAEPQTGTVELRTVVGQRRQFAPAVVRKKCIADLVEAVIGAFVLECGLDAGAAVARAMGAWPRADASTGLTMGTNPMRKKMRSDALVSIGVGKQVYVLSDRVVNYVQEKLGYRFMRKDLLEEALTHCSCLDRPNNQRMEFLGDAVLDFAVVKLLFAAQRWADPGQLSSQKSEAVCNRRLAAFCLRSGLYKHMLVMSSGLSAEINDITLRMESEINAAPSAAAAVANTSPQALIGGETELAVEYRVIDACKRSGAGALADLLEALVGAVFIDCKGDLEIICDIVRYLHILPQIQ